MTSLGLSFLGPKVGAPCSVTGRRGSEQRVTWWVSREGCVPGRPVSAPSYPHDERFGWVKVPSRPAQLRSGGPGASPAPRSCHPRHLRGPVEASLRSLLWFRSSQMGLMHTWSLPLTREQELQRLGEKGHAETRGRARTEEEALLRGGGCCSFLPQDLGTCCSLWLIHSLPVSLPNSYSFTSQQKGFLLDNLFPSLDQASFVDLFTGFWFFSFKQLLQLGYRCFC